MPNRPGEALRDLAMFAAHRTSASIKDSDRAAAEIAAFFRAIGTTRAGAIARFAQTAVRQKGSELPFRLIRNGSSRLSVLTRFL
jgi:hypothetical protein